MPAPEKIVTAEAIVQKPEDKPPLTEKQVEALDRDGDGKAGGSLKVGDVLKKGSAPEAVAEPRKDGLCRVRITKSGHGKVANGKTDLNAQRYYDWNDEVELPRAVGEALEGRAYAEIIG